MVAGRNLATDGIAPDRSGITINSPSDKAVNGYRSAPVLRGWCLLAYPLGPPERDGLAANSSILAGYHGIKAGLVSLATEA